MNTVKIVVGVGLVVMAAVVHGDTHSNQRCAIIHSHYQSWDSHAPDKCKPWSGCAEGSLATPDYPEGRCAGYVSAEVGDVSPAYPVMACEPVQTGTVYRCRDFVGVDCVDNGESVCLTYKVYYSTECLEDDAFPAAERYIRAYKCYSANTGA